MAKLSTLQDDFSGALNSAVWTAWRSIDTDGGTLNVGLTDPYGLIYTVDNYDLTDSSIIFRMNVDATATDDNWPRASLLLAPPTGGVFQVDYYSENRPADPSLTWTINYIGEVNSGGTVPWDAGLPWIRMAMAGSTFTLDRSPDGLTWTNVATAVTTGLTTRWSSCGVFIEGRWDSYAGVVVPDGTAHFDNVNLPPPPGTVNASLSAGAGMTVSQPNVITASLSAGGGETGASPLVGPGSTFLFGASGTGVADGSISALLPDPLALAGVDSGATLTAQTTASAIATGTGFETWTGPLDYSFGGIYPGSGDTWAAAATGTYLGRWRTALLALKTSWVPRDYSLLRLRFAAGMNASTSTWPVSNSDAAHFVDAYRLWADLVASILPGAQRVVSFAAATSSLTDARTLFPGRRWTDAVAVEAYNSSPHATTSGEVTTKLAATSGSNPVGPAAWLAQANTWAVPLAVTPWGNPTGTGGGDAPLWVAAMLNLFHANAGGGAGQIAWAVYANSGATAILPSGTSSQPSSSAVLAGATSTSLVVGGAINTPTAGTSTGTGAVGTTAIVGDNRTYAGPPPPSWPIPGDPGAYAIPDDVLPIKRVSDIYPDPVFTNGLLQADWEPTSTIVEDWGYFRIIVDGQDVSFFRGGIVIPDSFEDAEPFTETTASFTISHCVPTDVPGAGDLTWLRDGAKVDILHLEMSGFVTSRWAGEIIDFSPSKSDTDWQWQVQCTGELQVADLTVHKPPTFRDPTDIGTVIANTLNDVISRPYSVVAAGTGILTNKRGSADSSPLSFVQELLSTATTADGLQQWTVMRNAPDSYLVRIKDTTTQHWTMHCSQPGIDVNLSWDASTAPNVVYARGVGPDGYSWANWVYPGQGDAAPSYPFPSASTVMTIGSTGAGVTTWQQQINDLGIAGANVTVDGTYSAADATAAKIVQRYYGIAVDGIVGPQTWAATFDVGANGASLDGAKRLPVAWDPAVQPEIYSATGASVGANPTYDSSRQRREIDINFGDGVTKAQGVAAARAFLAREGRPGWAGTITLRADPQEGSKFGMVAGQNFRLRGWGSTAGPFLHIAAATKSPGDDSVTLTVDEKARDLPTLIEIMKRNLDNSTNPARLPEVKQRRSRIHSDAVVEFDGESTGGKVPRTALYAGLWSVLRIPVSQLGTVAKIELTTVSPVSEFTVAFFGAPVTAAQLIAHVGSSPLTARGDNFGPYDWDYDNLVKLGFQEALGGPEQAAGYDPGYQTSPITGGSTPLSGRLISTGAWTYQSVRPPWLWVAFWAKTSCFVSGRLFPQPIDL